jgi:NAD(P)-dependent dehydrogenase (short-subunit alcohol dehydrogenase family)
MDEPADLRGRRCLITGCSSGIGRATAVMLAASGAHVFATARDVGAIADLAAPGVTLLELDVTDRDTVERAVAAAAPLDVVVNNAGYGLEGAIEEIDDDELFAQYDVNVFGVWRMCRAVLPGMRERGTGTIVNVSSFGGQMPFPGIGAYRSSKFAVEGLSWTLHLEVANLGIRVIDVQPGLVDSDFGTRSIRRARRMTDDGPYGKMRAAIAPSYDRMSPPPGLAPDEVADAIVAELRRGHGPLHVVVGDDARRMIAAATTGEDAFHSLLEDELGLALRRPTDE